MAPAKERKIALMGFRSVGKSSLAIQFVQGQFIDHYEPTIENVFQKTVTVRGHDYELHLVDTAGQDEFSIMPPNYSVDIHGYVLVYSIDSRKSFEVCQTLHEKLVDLIGSNSIPVVLVGNKSDLHQDRQVTREDGMRMAQAIKAAFLETSARNNQGVSEVFQKVLSEMEKDSATAPDGGKTCVVC